MKGFKMRWILENKKKKTKKYFFIFTVRRLAQLHSSPETWFSTKCNFIKINDLFRSSLLFFLAQITKCSEIQSHISLSWCNSSNQQQIILFHRFFRKISFISKLLSLIRMIRLTHDVLE